ncbi:MAG: hypothetical protein DWQ18_09050 [Crenarchaeota archaeon]|nr:MAG: hypothetical protein DWQ17_00735 [Thermoproteota archaeon]RDJ33282.1 MAG: hypothetical protein DWQ18_09050 [Thermoproteota archaeon]
MNSLLSFSVLVFAIAGFLIMPIQNDAFATKDDNSGKAKGCENANENSKAKEKNPHCETVTIDPTSGPVGTAFTIIDPEGRIQSGDTAVFFLEGTDPSDGAVADNVSVSADGTTLTGNVPFGLPADLQYYVHVSGSGAQPERFAHLPFLVTAGSAGGGF